MSSTYDPTAVRDRVFSEIKAKVQYTRTGPAYTEPTSPRTPKPADPLFNHDEPNRTGYVWLSTLVPNWVMGKAPDVLVQVFDKARYSESIQANVPDVDPFYRPNLKALSMLAYAIENSDTGILLTGAPSVGKSSLANYLAAITNRPMYRFNYNGTMDASSLIGTQSASGGSTHWHDGMITEAIQVENAIVLHDEWTFAPAEVIAAMQYLLERNGKLILADKPGTVADKTIVPAKGVRMVFADNTKGNGDVTGKFVGTQPQNSATIDRIGTFIEVHFLEETDEVAMLRNMFPQATLKLVNSCVKVANLCRSAYAQGQVSTIMSLRVLSSWIQHSLNLRDVDAALEISFLNRFDDPSEKEAIKGFVNVVMGKGR